MDRTDSVTVIEPSIDSILRTLTNRPNVDATLILSRRDGSIIKATGFASQTRGLSGQNLTNYSTFDTFDDGADQPIDVKDNNEAAGAERKLRPSPAETLAASIFHFVSAATVLSTTLSTLSDPKLESSGRPQSNNHMESNAQQDNHTPNIDSEIQLLRMRTKQQEIIIFPDPGYLCCVVQNIGKHSNGNGNVR